MAKGSGGGPQQVEVSPRATLQQRAAKLRPLKQGQLDGLCGLYAGINALRLLLAAERPLSAAETKALFHVGIGGLVKHDRLASAVMNGIPNGTWRKILTKLVARANAITGQQITLTRPFKDRPRVSRRALFKVVEAAIDAGQPVVIALSGKHDHYAVLCGHTAHRLVQFDSGALSWLSRELCGPSNSRTDWRHEIDSASLMIVSIAAAKQS